MREPFFLGAGRFSRARAVALVREPLLSCAKRSCSTRANFLVQKPVALEPTSLRRARAVLAFRQGRRQRLALDVRSTWQYDTKGGPGCRVPTILKETLAQLEALGNEKVRTKTGSSARFNQLGAEEVARYLQLSSLRAG